MKKDVLTKLQRAFVNEYLKSPNLNATECVKKAGYKTKYPNKIAFQLLDNTRLLKEIEKVRKEREKRTEITQDRVLEELAYLGFSNIKDYVDASTAKGFVTFKDMDKIPEEKARAIEAIKANYKEGRIEFKLHSKTKTLEMIGRHLGMFIDKFDVGDALKEILIKRIIQDDRPED